jgi:chromate transport protein ChrA
MVITFLPLCYGIGGVAVGLMLRSFLRFVRQMWRQLNYRSCFVLLCFQILTTNEVDFIFVQQIKCIEHFLRFRAWHIQIY